MNSLKIKKNDKVVVLSGKDKGKSRRQGEEGGIVKREAAIYASKVQVICPKCDKPTRVAYEIKDGKKVRVCKHCGAAL